MPAMTSFFRPLSPRSGTQLAAGSAEVGTGGTLVVASSTASVHIAIPRRKCKLISLNYCALVAAAGAGTITATVIKRTNTGTPANVTQTAAFDLTATQITVLDRAYNIPITASDANMIYQVGDTCRIDLIASSTVTTQPTGCIVAEFAILA